MACDLLYPDYRLHRPQPEDRFVTTTDIGILLIVLCIVLWAIMAALHRHTVQLEALKTQLQALVAAQQRGAQAAPPAAPAAGDPPRHHDAD